MIINALSDYYYSLLEKGKNVPVSGWCYEKVSYALSITDNGELSEVVSLLEEETDAKGNSKIVPSKILVPKRVIRTAGVASNFLCDKSSYMLGISSPPNKKDLDCFYACKELHNRILESIHSPEADAVLNFFNSWDPEKAHEHQALEDCFDDVCAAGNLILMYRGKYISEYESIKSAWNGRKEESETGLCMISGRHCDIAKLHTQIRGIRGAQPSGASLVCFNNEAVESYGKSGSQALNAPISKEIMSAYTNALSYMVSNREHSIISLDNMTIFCWAKSADDEYSDVMRVLYGMPSTFSESDVIRAMSELAKGHRTNISGISLAPDEEFYILGISPNASRLSVRFFLKNNFGAFAKNVDEHYKRLDISLSGEKSRIPSVGGMLRETVRNKMKDEPEPTLAASVLKAVFNNTKYPVNLFSGVIKRLKADHQTTASRAAIIKAYLIKNSTNKKLKEALTLELNEGCKYVPYLLGRVFAVCEKIQKDVYPNLGSTIKDKYFDSACSTPSLVFPQILKLKNCHIKLLKREYAGKALYYEKMLTDILSSVDSGFPRSLNMEEQGVFILGYYHQNQKLYAKKEEE